MIDWFALALSHGLLAYIGWHLLSRDDLDENTVSDRDKDPPKGPRSNA